QPIDWLDPVLLPANSALILLNGEIKFKVVIFECGVARAQDHDSRVDGNDIRKEGGQPQ
ncbi:hypothetical protein QBC46DRAFT_273522, partial [Diplogelasinospora grovesii]